MTQPQIDLRLIVNDVDSELRKLYLEYVNDFLTYEGVARYYGWNLKFTTEKLEAGRAAHEAYCMSLKSSPWHNYKEGV